MKIIMKLKILFVFILIMLLSGLTISQSIIDDINNNSSEQSHKLSSFMDLSEGMSLKTAELSKLSSMMTSAGIKSKKRYTEDGRLCASAFAQEGQTFFDCTSTRSPDGQNKNTEWCYVDASVKAEKAWDWCKAIMDYDKIREQNQEQLKQFTEKARKANTEIEANIGPGEQALQQMKKTKQGQAELDQKISAMTKKLTVFNNNMQSLFNTKDEWEKQEKIAVEIAANIDARREKQKEEDMKRKIVEMDKTEDTIKKETAAYKLTVSPFVQSRWLSSSYSCEGMLLYEEESDGDGLIGQYYDNESFLGDFKEQTDSNIDFDYTGSSPTDGINSTNFSIRWKGFIHSPVTSMYQFAIECDDGATVTINNKIIISHNMYTASSESKSRVDKWLKEQVKKTNNPTKNYNKSTSAPIRLAGGTKFKIVVSYYHSTHNDIFDDNKAFVKFYWQSDEFEEIIVPKSYLYTQNAFPPLKLFGLNPEVAVVRKFLENDLAFKNNDQYILKDIPTDYEGSTSLKFNVKFLEKELVFTSNVPVIVYVGRLTHYPNPYPTDYEDTGEFMTILELNRPSANVSSKRLNSSRSGLIKIYKKKFEAGKITIPLNRRSINIKGVPLIVFFGFDSQTSSPISCGGKEHWISDPNSRHFKQCTESSFYQPDWKCKNGLNGQNKDAPGGMWAAQREGIGAWLNVEFKDLYEVLKIQFTNRRNPSERNSLVIAYFGTGEQFKMELKNVNGFQEFIIEPPIRTNSVKFIIKGVFGTINNGGAIKVFGTKCIDPNDEKPSMEAQGLEKVTGVNPKALPPLFLIKDKKPVLLSCRDSLSNSKKLDHIKQKVGNKVIVRCLENCASSNSAVYGDMAYSKDSAICKSAYHSQKLKSDGGLVKIVFGPSQKNYKGATRNAVKSRGKGKSDITLNFESFEDVDDIIMQNGSKVDIKVNNKWSPGVINSIKETKIGKSIVVSIEGAESTLNPIETSYPDKSMIKPCGDRVKHRDCKDSRLNPNTNQPIKIKFVPSSYSKPGDYLLDKGEVFGKTGKPFGWTKDMSNRMKTRMGAQSPEMDSLVEFPPSPKSKFCHSQEVLCDKVTWTVKVGLGKYNVKLYVGDPQANTRIDLKINDEFVVEGQTLTKGELKVYEGAYESVNQFLTVSTECRRDCEYAMSKLNMIEVSPFDEDESSKDEASAELEDPCGNSVEGGRCDKGPNVTHCLFEDPTAEGAKFCSGDLLMVQVSKQYRCPKQREKFKCVKRKYKNQNECVINCPGKCENTMCL